MPKASGVLVYIYIHALLEYGFICVGAIEDLHDFFGQPRDDILRCLRDKEGVDTEIADRAQHQGVL